MTSVAHATQQPDHMEGHRYYESALDPQPRLQRQVVHDPAWQIPAWQQFLSAEGGTWYSMWDAHTKVPLRIYGSGIAAPGAIDFAERAERHARSVLQRHLPLLSPGASLSDYALTVNDLTNGMRTVVFQQHYRGIPVLGGAVHFTFKHDRLIILGSEAIPAAAGLDGQVSSAHVAITDAIAETRALDWMRADFGDDAVALTIEGPTIAPVISDGEGGPAVIRSAATLVVTVSTRAKLGLWRVYIDMNTGAPVAREQMLRFGSGQLMYNTPVRWPGGDRANYPAIFASTSVDGTIQLSDDMGMIDWTGTADVSVILDVNGDFVDIVNAGEGGEYSLSTMISDGGVALADASADEFADAQITAFIHANIAKQEARKLNAELPWLAAPIRTTVNMPSDILQMLFCNAFSDGDTINFFEAFNLILIDCGNTARLPDVVYHEFGHSLHAQSLTTGSFDPALSEGLSDYYASTIQNDAGMGRGFFNSDEPLRDIDPVGEEAVWPEDIAEDPHTTGLIIAGALWDLRKRFVSMMGADAGRAYTDRLFYVAMQQSADIPSSYPHVLAADDDDGNISNGTPNSCLINEVFSAHGLANPLLGGFLVVDPIERSGFDISFRAVPSSGECSPPEVASASVSWQLRGDPGTSGDAPMTQNGDVFSGQIPVQAENSVVQYKVNMVLDNGDSAEFPRNPADTMYEFFVGEPEQIYCTDFEADPFTEGWTSSSSAGPDDWAWGMPRGTAGDPSAAYSGDSIIGNNLDGAYAPDASNTLTSPNIDVSGYGNIRLQYRRWLMIEDGVFDNATIYANGTQVWQNANSGNMTGGVHHVDGEWRFHDVDVTDQVANGSLQLEFALTSDPGLQMGGWSIDDLCVVSLLYCGDGAVNGEETCDNGEANSDDLPDACRSTCVPATCGDNVVDTGELCDSGTANSDTLANACRTNCQAAACGDGVTDNGEQCDDGNTTSGDGCSVSCVTEGGDAGGGGGCCSANELSTGDTLLWALVLFGLVVLARRRRLGDATPTL